MQHIKWADYEAQTLLSPLLVYGGSQSWVGGGSGCGGHWALLRQNFPYLVDVVLDADEDVTMARVPGVQRRCHSLFVSCSWKLGY